MDIEEPHRDDAEAAGHRRMLLGACVTGDGLLVRALLRLGADVNTPTSTGLTPLVVAAVNGHVDLVRTLLRHGATVCLRSLVPAITLADKAGPPGVAVELLAALGVEGPDLLCPALVFAVAEGDLGMVRELLRIGADPNLAGAGLQPLIVASERGQADMVRLLIDAKANPSRGSSSHLTPLTIAARNGCLAVVEVLLKADPEPEALDTALVFAGKMGHEVVVDALVRNALLHDPHFGPTALRLAVTDGCDLVIRRLLASRVDVNDCSSKGLSALLAASERGMESAVADLLAAGAAVDGGAHGTLTPLVVASVNGHAGVVARLLAAKADVSSSANISAVVLAGRHGHAAVVTELLASGAQRRSDFRSFALLFAIAEGCGTTIQMLLDAGADVNAPHSDGTTALMAASERGSMDTVQQLLAAGANVDASVSSLTALAVASRNGRLAVVQQLLDAGAGVATFETALLFAARNAHTDVVEEIVRVGRIQTRDPLTGRSAFLEGALRLAISANCALAVRCLLAGGTPVQDGTSPPPLMIACERGQVPIVALLLAAGADANTVTDNGLSALVVAAVNGHTAVVKQLLTNGALVANGENVHAVVLAGKAGHEEAVDLLVAAGQAEGADFQKAFLSAIVDNCPRVVATLLEAQVCDPRAENDMPLRLAIHQRHHGVVGHLLAAASNFEAGRFEQLFGKNPKLLDLLQQVARGAALGWGLHALEMLRLLHPSPAGCYDVDTRSLWWWTPPVGRPPPASPTAPCFCPLPGCPVSHCDVTLFLPGLQALRTNPDYPCLADGLRCILTHASHAWHEKLFPFLPLKTRSLVRLVVTLWSQRGAFGGVPLDLLLLAFGFMVFPEALDP
jgi:ankyrin repeat protein